MMPVGAWTPHSKLAPGLQAIAPTVSSKCNYNSCIYENVSILTPIHTCYLRDLLTFNLPHYLYHCLIRPQG